MTEYYTNNIRILRTFGEVATYAIDTGGQWSDPLVGITMLPVVSAVYGFKTVSGAVSNTSVRIEAAINNVRDTGIAFPVTALGNSSEFSRIQQLSLLIEFETYGNLSLNEEGEYVQDPATIGEEPPIMAVTGSVTLHIYHLPFFKNYMPMTYKPEFRSDYGSFPGQSFVVTCAQDVYVRNGDFGPVYFSPAYENLSETSFSWYSGVSLVTVPDSGPAAPKYLYGQATGIGCCMLTAHAGMSGNIVYSIPEAWTTAATVYGIAGPHLDLNQLLVSCSASIRQDHSHATMTYAGICPMCNLPLDILWTFSENDGAFQWSCATEAGDHTAVLSFNPESSVWHIHAMQLSSQGSMVDVVNTDLQQNYDDRWEFYYRPGSEGFGLPLRGGYVFYTAPYPMVKTRSETAAVVDMSVEYDVFFRAGEPDSEIYWITALSGDIPDDNKLKIGGYYSSDDFSSFYNTDPMPEDISSAVYLVSRTVHPYSPGGAPKIAGESYSGYLDSDKMTTGTDIHSTHNRPAPGGHLVHGGHDASTPVCMHAHAQPTEVTSFKMVYLPSVNAYASGSAGRQYFGSDEGEYASSSSISIFYDYGRKFQISFPVGSLEVDYTESADCIRYARLGFSDSVPPAVISPFYYQIAGSSSINGDYSSSSIIHPPVINISYTGATREGVSSSLEWYCFTGKGSEHENPCNKQPLYLRHARVWGTSDARWDATFSQVTDYYYGDQHYSNTVEGTDFGQVGTFSLEARDRMPRIHSNTVIGEPYSASSRIPFVTYCSLGKSENDGHTQISVSHEEQFDLHFTYNSIGESSISLWHRIIERIGEYSDSESTSTWQVYAPSYQTLYMMAIQKLREAISHTDYKKSIQRYDDNWNLISETITGNSASFAGVLDHALFVNPWAFSEKFDGTVSASEFNLPSGDDITFGFTLPSDTSGMTLGGINMAYLE